MYSPRRPSLVISEMHQPVEFRAETISGDYVWDVPVIQYHNLPRLQNQTSRIHYWFRSRLRPV